MRNHGCEREWDKKIEVLHNFKLLSPTRCYAVPKKIRKHKNMEPWVVSSKNPKRRKIESRQIKLLSQDFARNSWQARAKKDPGSREDKQSRAKMNPRSREIKQCRAKILSRSREAQTVSREIIQSPREERRFWRRSRAQRNLLARLAENLRAKILRRRAKVNDLARNSAPDRTDCTDSN